VNPFLEKLLGAVVRTAIVWLSAKFGASLSDDEVVKLTAEIVPVVLVLGWSFYQKFRERQKLLTAQSMGKGVTEHEVEAEIRAGNAPAVATPKDMVPV